MVAVNDSSDVSIIVIYEKHHPIRKYKRNALFTFIFLNSSFSAFFQFTITFYHEGIAKIRVPKSVL